MLEGSITRMATNNSTLLIFIIFITRIDLIGVKARNMLESTFTFWRQIIHSILERFFHNIEQLNSSYVKIFVCKSNKLSHHNVNSWSVYSFACIENTLLLFLLDNQLYENNWPFDNADNWNDKTSFYNWHTLHLNFEHKYRHSAIIWCPTMNTTQFNKW